MTTENTTGLQNITASGGVPKSRLNSAFSVQTMVQDMIRADDARSKLRAKVKGLVDGNAPFQNSELRRTGQAYRTNINFREAEAFLAMAMSAFFDVFTEVPHYAQVKIDHGDVNEQELYSRIVTEEFDRLQKQDGHFDYTMQLSQHEMVLYGIGPLVFEDSRDWRAKPIKAADLLVQENARSNAGDWELCVIRSSYQVHELYKFIRNEEFAAKEGWNIKEATDAIIAASPYNIGTRQSWEYHQQQLRNNDISYSSQCKTVKVAHVLYREFPTDEHPEGAISHCIVQENDSCEEFMYRKLNRYKNWSEIVHPMYYDKGDGTHHSVKGIGIKMYSALELKNRLRCSMVDSAVAHDAIHLQATTPSDLSRLNVINMGLYSIIPPGLNVAQISNQGSLQGSAMMERDLEGVLQSNLSQYRQSIEKNGNPRTATEIDAIVSQQATLGKTQLSRYYIQLDRLFEERYRRASLPDQTRENPGGAEAIKFQKRCIERGVPREALPHYRSVVASRTAGRGSSMERRGIMERLMQSINMLPEGGRKHVLVDYIASLAGHHSLERYYPSPEKDVDTQEQQQEAARENALFKIGAPLPIAGGDNHAVHAEVHFQAARETIQAAQQGMGDPAELGSYLAMMTQHIASHLASLRPDRTRHELLKFYEEQLKEIDQAARQLGMTVQQQQEQQAQQQQEAAMAQQQAQQIQSGQDPKEQLAAMRAEREEARRDQKLQSDLDRKLQKANQDMALKDAKTGQKMAFEQARNVSQT